MSERLTGTIDSFGQLNGGVEFNSGAFPDTFEVAHISSLSEQIQALVREGNFPIPVTFVIDGVAKNGGHLYKVTNVELS